MKLLYIDEKQTLTIPNSAQSMDLPANTKPILRDQVASALTEYFTLLGNAPMANLYQLMLDEIEPPLIQAVLLQTQFNRLQAAKILGINRTTFHKKLNLYQLDDWIKKEKAKQTKRHHMLVKILPDSNGQVLE